MKTEYPIVTSIGIAIGSAFVMLLSMTVFSFVGVKDEAFQLLCYSTCPMIIATLLFPFFCSKALRVNTKCDNNNLKSAFISIAGFISILLTILIAKE